MPNSSAIGALGIRTNSTADTATSPARSLPSLTGALASPLVAVGGSSSSKNADTVVVDAGIPALKQSLVDLILADNMWTWGSYPQPKASTNPSQPYQAVWEGNYSSSAASIIPRPGQAPRAWFRDMSTVLLYLLSSPTNKVPRMWPVWGWAQNVPSLGLSKKFKWPSWVVCDATFNQEAANMGKKDWLKIDGSIYAQCFTGMALAEGWCTICNLMDHLQSACQGHSLDDQSSSAHWMTSQAARGQPQ